MTHTRAFVTPVMDHWLEQEIAQWVHHEGLIRLPIANALTMEIQYVHKDIQSYIKTEIDMDGWMDG